MIFVKIQGRLGNQMFQYAFAYSLSKKLRTNYFLLETETHFKNRLNYFKLGIFEFQLKKILSLWYLRINKKRIKSISEYSNCEAISFLNYLGEDNILYHGFFQTDQYFYEFKNDIKKLFTLKNKYIKRFNDKFYFLIESDIPNLVIHYRGTDYRNWGGTDYTLPIDYYLHAMSLIENIGKYRLVILTDDITLAKNTFKSLLQVEYISDSEINDFQVLLNADKLIISNSTFAWWGAYLNYHNAEVFAPKYWLGFKIKSEYPPGIMSINWNWIDF